MAHIHFSRGKAYELGTNGDENPTEYLESAGELLIKQMVQKQLNKQVSLKEQLQEGKEFEACAEFVPLTKLTSGQISFSDFKELAEKVSHIEDLKSMGLTVKEIDFLNDYERGESYFVEKYKKVELTALKTHLEEIRKKLERRSEEEPKDKSGRSERGVSRHELELSLSVKPQSDHTKLLQFALSCQQTSSPSTLGSCPLNHPINNLKELESELFGHLKQSSSGGKRRRRKERREDDSHVPDDAAVKSSTSLWDSRVGPQHPRRKPVVTQAVKETDRVYDCAPKRMFTIRDGEIVTLDGEAKEIQKCGAPHPDSSSEGRPYVFANASGASLGSPAQLVPLEEIRMNKMEKEEMSEHPHFKNYSEGEPSQVLYIKNISPTVKEDDLVHLFGHFETCGENKIAYRMMTGRMKGQAFITFPTIQKASEALETINGYYCKGKPLVVQFGKSKK